jgi:hypothetical protein
MRVRQAATVELVQNDSHSYTMSCCSMSHLCLPLLLLLLLLLLQGTAAMQTSALSLCLCGRWQHTW